MERNLLPAWKEEFSIGAHLCTRQTTGAHIKLALLTSNMCETGVLESICKSTRITCSSTEDSIAQSFFYFKVLKKKFHCLLETVFWGKKIVSFKQHTPKSYITMVN